jgi:hypothetical protein
MQIVMCLLKLSALVLLTSCFSFPAKSADSLSEYIAAISMEATRVGSAPAVTEKQPSLDPQRLLRNSFAILHAASPAQRHKLQEAFVAYIPRYVIPADVSPIPNPREYLAFMELHIIYSELLDRASGLQRANWAGSDRALLEAATNKLCSAPSTIDFYRRALDQEISAGRYPETSIAEARALRERLVQRNAWYLSAENLNTCRDLTRIKVSP